MGFAVTAMDDSFLLLPIARIGSDFAINQSSNTVVTRVIPPDTLVGAVVTIL
jgi:hypothetical protein